MDLFLLKLIVSFAVGSLWITYATVLSEKLGTKIGGVIGTLPSTIVVSLFFIGWTQTPETAAEATTIVPFMMGITALFVLTYVYTLKWGFYRAVLSAITVWLALTLILITLHFNNLALSLLAFLILFSFCFYIMEYQLKITSIKGRSLKLRFEDLRFRGLLSGSIIVFSILMAKTGGPIIGGIFASFPAVTLATIIISYKAQGEAFSKSLSKIIMISGCINVLVYALAVKAFYPLFGLYLGSLVSFIISLIGAYIVYLGIKKLS